VAIEIVLNKAEQDILNQEPSNINVIRDFRSEGRAIRVWGARCITTDSAWKYLNVRRLCNFIEASLAQGTQYAGFEPNDEKLWAKISQNITGFLLPLWRAGALLGSKQEEAFFVKCDRTTMTQDDLDDGRLIILIGVAPIKPAEFVIIRIGQKSCATTVEEHAEEVNDGGRRTASPWRSPTSIPFSQFGSGLGKSVPCRLGSERLKFPCRKRRK
jgi:uncharacterized protein